MLSPGSVVGVSVPLHTGLSTGLFVLFYNMVGRFQDQVFQETWKLSFFKRLGPKLVQCHFSHILMVIVEAWPDLRVIGPTSWWVECQTICWNYLNLPYTYDLRRGKMLEEHIFFLRCLFFSQEEVVTYLLVKYCGRNCVHLPESLF